MPRQHGPKDEVSMYKYLFYSAQDLFENLKAMLEQRVVDAAQTWREASGRVPREHSDFTPERRLGKRLRRQHPSVRDEERLHEEYDRLESLEKLFTQCQQ